MTYRYVVLVRNNNLRSKSKWDPSFFSSLPFMYHSIFTWNQRLEMILSFHIFYYLFILYYVLLPFIISLLYLHYFFSLFSVYYVKPFCLSFVVFENSHSNISVFFFLIEGIARVSRVHSILLQSTIKDDVLTLIFFLFLSGILTCSSSCMLWCYSLFEHGIRVWFILIALLLSFCLCDSCWSPHCCDYICAILLNWLTEVVVLLILVALMLLFFLVSLANIVTIFVRLFLIAHQLLLWFCFWVTSFLLQSWFVLLQPYFY